MSKNPSIPRNQLFLIELAVIGLATVGLTVMVVIKSISIFKPLPPSPPGNMQMVQLQNAVNLINPRQE